MTLPIASTTGHITAGVVAAIWFVFAIVMWRRGKLGTERKIVSTIGIVGLTLFAAGVFSYLPKPEEVLEDIAGTLGTWTYLLVGVLAFLETGAFVGLVAPGEAAVIVGGVVAGQGEIDIRLLIGLVWFAAFAGDSVSFYFGHRLGREFMIKHGRRVMITEDRLVQVEKYMQEHGGKTILVGRFIGLVRALAPFIAGSSKMPYRRFMPYDIIGSGLWAIFFCSLGYIFSNNLSAVIEYAERGVLIFGWTIGTIVLIVYLIRRFRKPAERAKVTAWLDKQEQNPRRAIVIVPIRRTVQRIVLPVLDFFGPQLRFAWKRFTPGGLGLEFTTVMSVLIVASYSLYFYFIAALDWPTNEFTTRINNAAFRISDSIRSDWLNTLAEGITYLGAFPVAAAFTLIAAGYCISRRRVAEANVMILSLLLASFLTAILKNWTEVPRPPGPLTSSEGWSFPSGHAAYAVTYVAIAISMERIRDLFTRTILVVAAIALGGAIALSRVYLRVHYLSDVIGGTALGFLLLSLLSATALMIAHIRRLRKDRREEAAAESEGKVV